MSIASPQASDDAHKRVADAPNLPRFTCSCGRRFWAERGLNQHISASRRKGIKSVDAQKDEALTQLQAKLRNREVRMRQAHRLISELLHYEGLALIDESRADEWAEIVMDGLSLGPPDQPDLGGEGS